MVHANGYRIVSDNKVVVMSYGVCPGWTSWGYPAVGNCRLTFVPGFPQPLLIQSLAHNQVGFRSSLVAIGVAFHEGVTSRGVFSYVFAQQGL